MRRERIVWIALATALLVLVAYLDWRLTQAPSSSGPVVNFGVSFEPALPSGDDPNPTWPAISPDGKTLVFTGNSADGRKMLWVRRLDEFKAIPLAGSEHAELPFWSPNGEFVAFFAEGKLKKVSLSGGQPFVLCESNNSTGGTWNRDNDIVFLSEKPSLLLRVSSEGGMPVELERWNEAYRLSYPRFLPMGEQFLYDLESSIEPHLGGWYISLGMGRRRKLLDNALLVQYIEPGYLLVLNTAGRLTAQRYDRSSTTRFGQTKPLAEGIAGFSASENGVIAYRTTGPMPKLGVIVNWLTVP
jgi:serine/threonine-protein kinase